MPADNNKNMSNSEGGQYLAIKKRKYTEDGGIKVAQDPSVFYNSSDPQQILSYVTDPCPFDVLLGRGLLVNNFTGNVFYRNLIASRRIEYSSTQKRQRKHEIALQILGVIRDEKGGRFLRELKTSAERAQVGYVLPLSQTTNRSELSGAWIVVDDRTCTKKIKHALRDPDSSSLILGIPRSASELSHQSNEMTQDPSLLVLPTTTRPSFAQPNAVLQLPNNRLSQNMPINPAQLLFGSFGIMPSIDLTSFSSDQLSLLQRNVALDREKITLPLDRQLDFAGTETGGILLHARQRQNVATFWPRDCYFEDFFNHDQHGKESNLLQQHQPLMNQNDVVLRSLESRNLYQGTLRLHNYPGLQALPQQIQWKLLQGQNSQLRNQQVACPPDSKKSTKRQSMTQKVSDNIQQPLQLVNIGLNTIIRQPPDTEPFTPGSWIESFMALRRNGGNRYPVDQNLLGQVVDFQPNPAPFLTNRDRAT